MKKILVAAALGLGVAAVPAPGARPVAETITYETGPCFGRCPVYRVRVGSDGSGRFEGIRFTAVIGARAFRTTPAQYRAFVARLAPDRPVQGDRRFEPGSPLCHEVATDQGSVRIVWRGRAEQSLSVYFGCDMDTNRAMFDRLASAPAVLPIGDFIRRRR